jgi:hypothetical protein
LLLLSLLLLLLWLLPFIVYNDDVDDGGGNIPFHDDEGKDVTIGRPRVFLDSEIDPNVLDDDNVIGDWSIIRAFVIVHVVVERSNKVQHRVVVNNRRRRRRRRDWIGDGGVGLDGVELLLLLLQLIGVMVESLE